MKRDQERLGNGVLIDDGDGQIVVFPTGLRFRGTLVNIGRSGSGVCIEPMTPKTRAAQKPTPKKRNKNQRHVDRA